MLSALDFINNLIHRYQNILYIFGAVFALIKYLMDRADRIKWEKTNRARQLINDLDQNKLAVDATYMLGRWQGREYTIIDGFEKFKVSQDKLKILFENNSDVIDPQDIYILECIDNLLFHFEQIFYSIDNKTIEDSLVVILIKSYLAGLREDNKISFINFSKQSGYSKTALALEKIKI
jgi:hypothetical protein